MNKFNSEITPMRPEQQAAWDYAMTSMYTGMVKEALEYLLRRPDAVLYSAAYRPVTLRMLCRRIKAKIGFTPNPVWVRSQCAAICIGRGY